MIRDKDSAKPSDARKVQRKRRQKQSQRVSVSERHPVAHRNMGKSPLRSTQSGTDRVVGFTKRQIVKAFDRRVACETSLGGRTFSAAPPKEIWVTSWTRQTRRTRQTLPSHPGQESIDTQGIVEDRSPLREPVRFGCSPRTWQLSQPRQCEFLRVLWRRSEVHLQPRFDSLVFECARCYSDAWYHHDTSKNGQNT